jgi:hypothetical protein
MILLRFVPSFMCFVGCYSNHFVLMVGSKLAESSHTGGLKRQPPNVRECTFSEHDGRRSQLRECSVVRLWLSFALEYGAQIVHPKVPMHLHLEA